MSGMDERRGIEPKPFSSFLGPYAPKPPGSVDPNTTSPGRWAKPLSPQEATVAAALEAAIARSIQTVELAPYQGFPFRGDQWEEDTGEGFIVNAVADAGGSTALTVSTATGASFTESASNRERAVLTHEPAPGQFGFVEYIQFRLESDLGYRRVDFTFEIQGSPALALAARNMPFARDGKIYVRKLILPGRRARLLATNNSTESAHLVEARMVGWDFPFSILSDSQKGLLQNQSSR